MACCTLGEMSSSEGSCLPVKMMNTESVLLVAARASLSGSLRTRQDSLSNLLIRLRSTALLKFRAEAPTPT